MTSKLAEIEEALEVCNRWLKHIEQQEQNTIKMQKAAALARNGDKIGALRLKSEVDNQPRVFDGANFLDVMPVIISTLTHIKALISSVDVEELREALERVNNCEAFPSDAYAVQDAAQALLTLLEENDDR